IDKKGISHALRLAVRRCIDKLKTRLPDGQVENSKLKIVLDGSLYAPPEYNQRTIIKGDEKIPIIAAASIIAKVTHDRKMVRLAKKYPKYSFHIHKGYGTKLHYKLVKKHGLCDIHRRSYCSRLI
ncbi:MAG: ribonuclease H, partial [Candidatus Giovannonibacteria bacterium GW2011_GWB1_43_13]